MSKFEKGEFVVALTEDDSSILNGKLYKVLECGDYMLQLRDEDGDLRCRGVDKYQRMSKEEFSELLSIKEEFERVKKENQANEAIIGHHVRRIQIMTREIDSLKHKLKTIHEVTSLIGGYEE